MEKTESKQAIKFDYFNIFDYIGKIKLCKDINEHALYSEMEYMNYMNKLISFDSKEIDLFLINTFYRELRDSNLIEDNIIYPEEVLNGDVYLDNFNISDARIKRIHNFATRGTCPYEYRTNEVWVSAIRGLKEHIFWYGAKPEDIQKFINDFMELYKSDIFNDNIFLKCALIHLIFIRIHPFKDGNGRTCRLITNMKFAEMTNALCGHNFKISPLHLSHSIYRNRAGYSKHIDNIYFDLDNFNNDDLNKWFEFMLRMYDEQLYYMGNRLTKSEKVLKKAIKLEEQGMNNIEISKTITLK